MLSFTTKSSRECVQEEPINDIKRRSKHMHMKTKIKYMKSGPEVIKLFVLNSAEHEIFSANKYENVNNCWHFHIY